MKVVVVVWVGGTPAGPSSCPWHQSCSLVRWKHRMPGLEGSSCSCFSVFSLQGRGHWRLREGTRPAQGCTEVAMLRADHSLWNQPGLVCVDFGKVFLLLSLFPPLGSGPVMPAFGVEQCVVGLEQSRQSAISRRRSGSFGSPEGYLKGYPVHATGLRPPCPGGWTCGKLLWWQNSTIKLFRSTASSPVYYFQI